MSEAYKVLARNRPLASTWTMLYTCPTGKQAVVNELTVTHTTDIPCDSYYFVAVLLNGEVVGSITTGMCILYNRRIAEGDPHVYHFGITLGSGESLAVSASSRTVMFLATGVEIT